MKKLKKTLWGTLFVLCAGGFLSAQSTRVIEGKKAKLVLIEESEKLNTTCVTSDGRFVGGTSAFGSADFGFIYDAKMDTVSFVDAGILGLSDDMKIWLGARTDTTFGIPGTTTKGIVRSSIYQNGEWKWVELNPRLLETTTASAFKYVEPYALSADGSQSVGLTYTYEKNNFSTGKPQQLVYTSGIWKGTKLEKILPHPFAPIELDDFTGRGLRATGMSRNGKVFAGFADYPAAGWQRSPCIWMDDTVYYVGDIYDPKNPAASYVCGEAYGASSDGTYVVGFVSPKTDGIQKGFIYNTKTKTRQFLPFPDGCNELLASSVSDNGFVMGTASGAVVASANGPFIYTPELGSVLLVDYVKELYGLIIPKSTSLTNVMMSSPDGKLIGGTCGELNAYVLILEEEVLNSAPRRIIARQIKKTSDVSLSWNPPMYCGKHPLGYKVYCDSLLISGVNPVTDTFFIQKSVSSGAKKYNIVAVYGDGVSNYSTTVELQVIEVGGCYTVKEIDNEITYNKTVNLSWGPPRALALDFPLDPFEISSAISEEEKSRNRVQREEILQNASSKVLPIDSMGYLPKVTMFNTASMTMTPLIKIGDKYYAGNARSTSITVFDDAFNIIDYFEIPNLPSIISMEKVGDLVYAISGNTMIYVIDLENRSLVKGIAMQENIVHLTYIPSLDGGKGGFEVGNYKTSQYINMKGVKLEDGITLASSSGTQYHDGYIYALDVDREKNNYTLIHQFRASDKKYTGVSYDLKDIKDVSYVNNKFNPPGDVYATGISGYYLEDSTYCLGVMLGFDFLPNYFIELELSPNPNLLTYNIFRNGQKINTGNIRNRSYADVITTAGEYKYSVSSNFKGGCQAAKSKETIATIYPIGTCAGPRDLLGRDAFGNVVLDWQLPTGELMNLVGFNVYRNNQLLADKEVVLRYTDHMPAKGEYTYRVETFWNNSCVASDSVKINVTGEGKMMPPKNLKLTKRNADNSKSDVVATWETPSMDEPMSIGYGIGSPIEDYGVGFTEMDNFAAFIGWDSLALLPYKEYSLVGVEFFMVDELTSLSPMVILNDKIMYKKDAGRIRIGEWQRALFTTTFSMNQPRSVEVGYQCYHPVGKGPGGLDVSPAKKGFGDIITIDFNEWTYLKNQGAAYDHNWAIFALVAKTRDIETAGANWQNDPKVLATVKRMNAQGLQAYTKPVKVKAKAKGGFTLDGFNIYKNDTKLNTELIKTLSYTDQGVANGKYDYQVSSVWNQASEEVKGDKVSFSTVGIEDDLSKAGISVYPNPAVYSFNIKGDYKQFEICDIKGSVVVSQKQTKAQIDVSALAGGVYTLRVTLADGQIVQQKLVVNK